MTDTANAPERISDDDLRKLLDEATPGPWAYRPEPYDDWGMVRSGSGFITQARDPRTSCDDLGVHRSAGTDPWGPNARLISLAPDLAKDRLEHATHCAELVAAAYLDARDSINEYPRVAPEADEANAYDEQIEHCQGIIDARTPDNALAALTARDERMKAEGAREAQAKIARLTEALMPFSDMAGEMFARNWDASRLVIALDNPEQINRVYVSDFFAARKAIGAEHASDCAVHNGPAYPSGSCTCGAALQENADG